MLSVSFFISSGNYWLCFVSVLQVCFLFVVVGSSDNCWYIPPHFYHRVFHTWWLCKFSLLVDSHFITSVSLRLIFALVSVFGADFLECLYCELLLTKSRWYLKQVWSVLQQSWVLLREVFLVYGVRPIETFLKLSVAFLYLW